MINETNRFGGPMRIVLATKNKGKLVELSEMLCVPGIEFVPMSKFDIPDIEETERSFFVNAVLKARAVCEITGLPAIADDNGLEIDILGGFLGINSARCAGENATDEQKRDFVLDKLREHMNRNAQFVCCIAFCKKPYRDDTFFGGHCRGEILKVPKGIAKPGLQYDSIFYLPELGKTFAELSDEEKNKISHRGLAIRKMKYFLETQDFTKEML